MSTKIIRVFTDYKVEDVPQLLGTSISDLTNQGIEIILNRSGNADLVLVLNMVTTPRWVRVPRGSILKVLQEPVILNPITHLFTYRHSRIYDRIFTHSPDFDDARQTEFPPCIGSFVDSAESLPHRLEVKTQLLSIIASNLTIFPGHKLRNQFIEDLLQRCPNLEDHTYGRGRKQELHHKIDGLRKYRFSIAIENSFTPSYITEKFYDCINANCIPVYCGAPNISSYFPADSYISLPITNIEESIRILSKLSEEEYNRRLPALTEARDMVREKFTLASIIVHHVKNENRDASSKRHTVLLMRIDGLLGRLQRIGITTAMRRILYRIHHYRRILSS